MLVVFYKKNNANFDLIVASVGVFREKTNSPGLNHYLKISKMTRI